LGAGQHRAKLPELTARDYLPGNGIPRLSGHHRQDQ
jgi:hypothetical protein